jgi:polyisoprenoid-binding protein YceI
MHVGDRYVAGFSANTVINRSHFGMINSVPFVSEDVRILIETEGIRTE